jgi:hypothetical protein
MRCDAMSFFRIPSPKICAAAAALILAASVGIARADILELRTGEIVQGKFLGGSPLNIRFQVDGQEKVFATKDVLNIGFTDSGGASNAQPAAPSPAADTAADADPDSTAAANAPPSGPPSNDSQAGPAPQSSDPQSATTTPTSTAPPLSSSSASSSSPTPNGQAILIPAGTSVLVRMIDSIDSSKNQVGDTFRGSLEAALVVGNTVVAPKDAEAYGKLTQVKEAGKLSGTPELTLELTGIRISGTVVSLDSTDYNVAGKSRGKQSAQRIGGGAIVGAVLGGIIGGPGGAAIGATLGAGGGTAVQVSTHGDRVRVPSETLLEFRLQQDVNAPSNPPGGAPAN